MGLIGWTIEGGWYPIVMEIEADDEPAGFEATIVCVIAGEVEAGTPDSTPVWASRAKPSGKEGATIHVSGPSPKNDGVNASISTPRYNESESSP